MIPLVLCRSAFQIVAEPLIEIAGRVEAHRHGKFGDGSSLRTVLKDQVCGHVDPVLDQILKRRHLQCSLKATAAFTLADVDCIRDGLQRNIVRVMFMNVGKCLLGTGLVGTERILPNLRCINNVLLQQM